MAWYWIVLMVLAALLLLLMMTKVGVLAAFDADGLQLDVKIGCFALRILPSRKKKAKEKNAQEEKPQEETAEGEKPKKKKLPSIAFADILDALRTLWPPLKKALGRTRRGIRVKPLDVSLTVGAEQDPAAGAQLYGYLHGGIWTVMPVLEQLLVIPDPHIHVGIDFENSKTAAKGRVGIAIRVGTLVMVAFGVAIPALRWFLKWRKQQKHNKKTTSHRAAA